MQFGACSQIKIETTGERRLGQARPENDVRGSDHMSAESGLRKKKNPATKETVADVVGYSTARCLFLLGIFSQSFEFGLLKRSLVALSPPKTGERSRGRFSWLSPG